MKGTPLRLPAGAALLSLIACSGDPSRQSLAPTTAILPASEAALVVQQPSTGGVRASNVPPRLVLRTTPALDTTTSPPTLRGTAPFTVQFNLCGSNDADAGDSLNWQFHFGDSGSQPFGTDGVFKPDFDHQCRVEHTYREGSWLTTLSVTDKHLEDQGRGEPRALARTTTQIRIDSVAPEPAPTPATMPSGPSGPTFRYIFVTSTTFDGDLGGLLGADLKCQQRAQLANLPNPTNFMAWLSDSVASPSTRFVQSTLPYRNVLTGSFPTPQPGTVVANNWADLTDGSLQNGLADEFGNPPSTTSWTNTLINGAPGGALAGAHCGDWHSNSSADAGNTAPSLSTSASWTQNGFVGCDNFRRLNCVQQ